LEPILILVVVHLIPESRGIDEPRQQIKMIKSFAAFGIFALLGASVIALPGFAPKVEAREVAVLVKGDRLAIRSAPVDCSRQVWPNFATPCLLNPGSDQKIVEARLVTARR
jgi:hypothetical protein